MKFGLDIGVSSVGFAVVEEDYHVIESGSVLFECADASKNVERRTYRGSRRLSRRRIHRLERFEKLWSDYSNTCVESNKYSPLLLRNQAIEKKISKDELYIVLKNMLKHRGIAYLDDAVDEKTTGDFQKALNNNAIKIKDKHPCEIQMQKLNTYGKYRGDDVITDKTSDEPIPISNVFTKSAYLKEIQKIFEVQRQHHSFIDESFVEQYLNIFSIKREYYVGPGSEHMRTDYGIYTTQPDGKGSYITEANIFEKLIGKCSVYKDELRASAASFTAQEFNFLNDMNNLMVNGRKLTIAEKQEIKQQIFTAKSIRMKDFIKKAIGQSIEDITGARVDKKDKEIFHTFEPYRKIKKIFEEQALEINRFTKDELDEIAHILTINTEKESILKAFADSNIFVSDKEQECFIITRKKFSSLFSKWHSLSLKIMNEIMDELYNTSKNQMQILTELGVFKSNIQYLKEFNKIPQDEILKYIYNPVVNRAVRQSVKVLNALIDKYGYPDDIVIEMPRDKNDDEKKKRIKDTQSKLEKELKDIILYVDSNYGIKITDDNFYNHKKLKTKLRLWHEQDEKCLYSGKTIDVNDLIRKPNLFEIDHIIPISISFDDSRSNKVLVYREENQMKGNKTAYMYLSEKQGDWNLEKYQSTILSLYGKKKIGRKKKDNFLFKEDISKQEVVKGFINRNLNDTRYACRVVLNTVQGFTKAHEQKTKVKVINGNFTNQLRKRLKLPKDRDESYAHHAVDAMIICYSTMGLDRLTKFNSEIIDFESGEIKDEKAFSLMEEETVYEQKLFYNMYKQVKDSINEAQEEVKYHFKVDKKANRKLSNETIYGTREKDDIKYKISKISDIYSDDGCKKFLDKVKKNKQGDFLIYQNDRRSFDLLLKALDDYKDKKNPLDAFRKEHGEPIRKYSKKGNGPYIQSLKYYDGKVGSCIDISHKYGHEKGSKKVILDSLNPYRTDVYFKKSDNTYHLAGIKYADFKFEKGTGNYVLNNESYNKVLISQKILKEGQDYKNIEMYGYEFLFSLYKNDFLIYEKNGVDKLERFLSQNSQSKNKIETKPIYAKEFQKRNFVYLSTTKKLQKVNTDILGNQHVTKNEKFSLSVNIDK